MNLKSMFQIPYCVLKKFWKRLHIFSICCFLILQLYFQVLWHFSHFFFWKEGNQSKKWETVHSNSIITTVGFGILPVLYQLVHNCCTLNHFLYLYISYSEHANSRSYFKQKPSLSEEVAKLPCQLFPHNYNPLGLMFIMIWPCKFTSINMGPQP